MTTGRTLRPYLQKPGDLEYLFKDTITVTNTDEVVCDSIDPNLPDSIEHTLLVRTSYPQFPDTAYGFLSRSCPRNCGFYIVTDKEYGSTSKGSASLNFG